MIHVRLFGVFLATDDNSRELLFPTNKVRALFAYLLLQRGEWVARQELAALLWTELGEEAAQKNLRNTLSRLRESLGDPAWLLATRQSIQLCPAAEMLWLDVAQFDHLWARLQHNPERNERWQVLEEAAEHYRGDFLRSLTLRDSELFESWRRQKQEEYHSKAIACLEQLADHALASNDFSVAISYARRQLALEPWREKAHRQLMLAWLSTGDTNAALAQFELCRKQVRAELHSEPEAETLALYQRIHTARQAPIPSTVDNSTVDESASATLQAAALSSVTGAVPSAHRPRHNLPSPLSPFVGREQEVMALHNAIRTATYRLHVLTGMGGIGKSRLALQIAAQQLDHFTDGVYFVSLAELTSVSDLIPAIARRLALPMQDHQPLLAQLSAALQNRHLLLLLDNAEHLLGEDAAHKQTFAKLLLQLLQECPRLVLLVTSRIRLNLRVENLFQLDGLSFPDRSLPVDAINALNSQDLLQFEAIQLFVEQTQRVDKRFKLADNAKWIVQICQQLHGLPLGIELAAAQLAESESATVAAALARNLGNLQVDYADLPARHQSLRAIFEYSWQRLSPEQQTVLACCALFQGGFYSEDLPLLLPNQAPSALTPLLEHSLLYQQADGRYHFHPLVQQCASEHLPILGIDQSALERQHSAAFLSQLGLLAPLFDGEELSSALATTERHWENFHAAWHNALRHNLLDSLERALDSFFASYFHRRFHEAGAALWAHSYAMLGELSADPHGVENAQQERIIIKLQLKQARHLFASDDLDKAIDLLNLLLRKELEPDHEMEAYVLRYWCDHHVDEVGRQRAAQIYSRLTQPRLQAEYWRCLAAQQTNDGNFAHAYRSSAQSIALYQSCRDLAGQIMAYHTHAIVATHQGNFQQARSHLESAMRLAEQRHDRWAKGFLHEILGIVSSRLGDHSAAITSFSFELHLSQQSGQRTLEQMMLMNLAVEESILGQYEIARSRYEGILGLSATEPNAERIECITRINLALLLHTIGDQESALAQNERALYLVRELQLPSYEGYALTNLGHILSELGRWQQAEEAYQAALALRQQHDETVLQLETCAGLARLALTRGDLSAAQDWIAPILDHLQSQTLDGCEEPLRIYLTCYHVLKALQDQRTDPFAQQMYGHLHERAQRISDRELQRSFLEKVPYHREILRAGNILAIFNGRGWAESDLFSIDRAVSRLPSAPNELPRFIEKLQ